MFPQRRPDDKTKKETNSLLLLFIGIFYAS